MTEIWVETGNNKQYNSIVAISNTGLLKTKSGEIRESKYREHITFNGKKCRVYQFIAKHFIPKTEEDIKLNRNCIDHITHNPVGMNINDVRNMRWCTNKENSGFEEARRHRSESLKGKKLEPRSEFGRKFLEHYGLHSNDDVILYMKEKSFYHRHNKKCSWEE